MAVPAHCRQGRAAMLFATSDTHFNHVNIIKYCGRPFTPDEEGAEKCKAFLLERYRETVGENDIVIFLGDLAMGGAMRIRDEMPALVHALPGRKIMIRGNHDGLEPGFYRKLGFSLVLDWLILGGMFFCHYPLEPADPRYPEGKIALALSEKFRASGATVLYHGHIHDKEPFHGDGITRINVSVDYRACDYRPVKVQGDEAEKEAAKLLDRAMKLRPEKGGLIKEGRLS